jgi:hypothetical protein
MTYQSIKGASKNSEFAQMPHKGTPIRYEQNQPVRNRQQGAENEVSVCRVDKHSSSTGRKVDALCLSTLLCL